MLSSTLFCIWTLTTCLVSRTLAQDIMTKKDTEEYQLRRSQDDSKNWNAWQESSGDGPDLDSLKYSAQFHSPSSFVLDPALDLSSMDDYEDTDTPSLGSVEEMSRTSVWYPGPSSHISAIQPTFLFTDHLPSHQSSTVPSFHPHLSPAPSDLSYLSERSSIETSSSLPKVSSLNENQGETPNKFTLHYRSTDTLNTPSPNLSFGSSINHSIISHLHSSTFFELLPSSTGSISWLLELQSSAPSIEPSWSLRSLAEEDHTPEPTAGLNTIIQSDIEPTILLISSNDSSENLVSKEESLSTESLTFISIVPEDPVISSTSNLLFSSEDTSTDQAFYSDVTANAWETRSLTAQWPIDSTSDSLKKTLPSSLTMQPITDSLLDGSLTFTIISHEPRTDSFNPLDSSLQRHTLGFSSICNFPSCTNHLSDTQELASQTMTLVESPTLSKHASFSTTNELPNIGSFVSAAITAASVSIQSPTVSEYLANVTSDSGDATTAVSTITTTQATTIAMGDGNVTSTVDTTTAMSSTLLRDEKYWIQTVLGAEPQKWLPNTWDELPIRLSRLYLNAFRREAHSQLYIHHRERRRTEEISVSVQLIGWSVNLSKKQVELLYTVTKDGVPILAREAAVLLAGLTQEELDEAVGFPVVIAAQTFQKGPSMAISSVGRQWVILVAVGVTGISLALLICGALFYYRCCRKADPTIDIGSEPSSPNYGSQNVKRLLREGSLSLEVASSGDSKAGNGEGRRPLPEVPESDRAKSSKHLGTFLETPRNEGTQTEGIVNLGFEDEEGRSSRYQRAVRKPIKDDSQTVSPRSTNSDYFEHVDKPEAGTLPSQASLAQPSKERKKKVSNRVAASPPSVAAPELKACMEMNKVIDGTIAATRYQAAAAEEESSPPRVVWTIYKANADGTATELEGKSPDRAKDDASDPLFVYSDKHPSNLDHRSAERPVTAPEASSSGQRGEVGKLAASDPHLIEAVKDELDSVSMLRVKEPTQSVIKAIKEELKKFNTSLPGVSPESSA